MLMMRTLAQIRSFCSKASTVNSPIPKECFIWGNSSNGLLGLGDTSSAVLTPQKLSIDHNGQSISAFRSISAGRNHSAFVSAQGQVFTSGKSNYGVLGNPKVSADLKTAHMFASKHKSSPTHVEALSDRSVVSVHCGDFHTIALDSNGKVWTWGYGGSSFPPQTGALGHPSKDQCDTPKQIEALEHETIVQISAGKLHSYALTDDGRLFSWGQGEFGRLGNGLSSDQVEPFPIDPSMFFGEKVTAIRSGAMFGIALTENGHVYSWGRNDHAQLGIKANFSMDFYALETTPCWLEDIKEFKFTDIACSERLALGCTEEGRVFLWGDSVHYGPSDITHMFLDRKITHVAAGKRFQLAVDSEGVCYSWGRGGSMCLGHGDKNSQDTPGRIDAFVGRKVTNVFAGYQTAAAFVEPE